MFDECLAGGGERAEPIGVGARLTEQIGGFASSRPALGVEHVGDVLADDKIAWTACLTADFAQELAKSLA